MEEKSCKTKENIVQNKGNRHVIFGNGRIYFSHCIALERD